MEGVVDFDLASEEIVVGLTMPQAPAEARILKLIVRMMQTGRLNAQRLGWLARQQRSEFTLHWLVQKIPEPERVPSLHPILERFREPPRGYYPLSFQYDAQRLIRPFPFG